MKIVCDECGAHAPLYREFADSNWMCKKCSKELEEWDEDDNLNNGMKTEAEIREEIARNRKYVEDNKSWLPTKEMYGMIMRYQALEWVLDGDSDKIICPNCGYSGNGVVKTKGDKVICPNCGYEVKGR